MRIPKVGDTMYIKDEETGKPISVEVIKVIIDSNSYFGGFFEIKYSIDESSFNDTIISGCLINDIGKIIFYNKEDVDKSADKIMLFSEKMYAKYNCILYK